MRSGTSISVAATNRTTHDYERHLTTMLFAALNVLDGTVVALTSLEPIDQPNPTASSSPD